MISVSFLKSIYPRSATIQKIDASEANFIHVDIMDGEYVIEKTKDVDNLISDLKNVHKPLDVHLMVQEPLVYIEKLIDLPIAILTVHLNTLHLEEAIECLKDHNIKVGLAINPNEDVTLLNDYLAKIDYVLVMGVMPGLGGQPFNKSVLSKIRYLENKYLLIGIDGGINGDAIKLLKGYHIDNIVSGSYVCMNADFNKQIDNLKNEL